MKPTFQACCDDGQNSYHHLPNFSSLSTAFTLSVIKTKILRVLKSFRVLKTSSLIVLFAATL